MDWRHRKTVDLRHRKAPVDLRQWNGTIGMARLRGAIPLGSSPGSLQGSLRGSPLGSFPAVVITSLACSRSNQLFDYAVNMSLIRPSISHTSRVHLLTRFRGRPSAPSLTTSPLVTMAAGLAPAPATFTPATPTTQKTIH